MSQSYIGRTIFKNDGDPSLSLAFDASESNSVIQRRCPSRSSKIYQRFGEERIRVTISITTSPDIIWSFQVSPEDYFAFVKGLNILILNSPVIIVEDREEPLSDRELTIQVLHDVNKREREWELKNPS